MKNQFFGDIRDYRKYGLLRILTRGKKASAAVCWMLTPNVCGAGGNHTKYLSRPKKWRRFDPDLFDALYKAVIVDGERDVVRAETTNILDPKIFSFYKKLLTDDLNERREYFQRFASFAKGRDFVFFDPDNGLEVKGPPLGKRNSSKFLYFEELSKTFSMGHSVLVFQFFTRKKAEDVIAERTSQIFSCLDVNEIASFKTPAVIYFLIPQPSHVAEMKERGEQVRQAWPGEICPVWHSRLD